MCDSLVSEEAVVPTSWHDERRKVLADQRRAILAGSTRISQVRVALFVGIVGLLAWAEAAGTNATPKLVAAGVLLGLFCIAVFSHHKVRRRLQRVSAGHDCHTEALHRASREWERIVPPSDHVPEAHPYASDLDVVGKVSVLSLLSAVRTPIGRHQLTRWLLTGVDPEQVAARQVAVRELAKKRILREEIEVAARVGVRPSSKAHNALLEWLQEPRWLRQRGWLVWLARANTVLTIGLIACHLSGVVPYALWLLPTAANFALSRWYLAPIRKSIGRVEDGSGSLGAYQNILALVERENFAAPRLRELHTGLRSERGSADLAIARLRRLAGWCGIRRSWIAPVLQGLMLWEVHLMASLEKWRAVWGQVAPEWFDIVGETEVLTAFAGILDDHPSWCFPTFTKVPSTTLSAIGVGHPLLPDDKRVCNDVEIGPRGSFLFVTGSNMSGKSTLLRAVGLNVVLARAGSPVCAKTFTLPVVRLYTNMRVQDSLASGESYFLAALRRLKVVVDAARAASTHQGPPVLYLLDEILQGTNSAERKIAVAEILRELLSLNAIGAVTSHDLTLADADDLKKASRPVHFSEQVHGDGPSMTMTFDYRLRGGIAPTTNALRLMQIIGLANAVPPSPVPDH